MRKLFKKNLSQGKLYFKSSTYFVSAFCLLLFMCIAPSCTDEDTGPKRIVLIDSKLLLNRTAHELRTYLAASTIDIDENLLQYDVDVYKVSYKTTYKGSDVTASGIVVLPRTEDEVPMISFQHGTIVSQNAAPTGLPLNSNELILYAALSSTGFIGVMPDYIGFGDSKLFFHPYYVEDATAQPVIDNLKAASEWAAEKDVKFNQRLFLAGYSQGGYVTMATHKEIEANPVSGFNLIASFPAAGGYDVKGMQEYFFEQETYQQPYYIGYVALSYKSFYSWNENTITQFFKEPYGSRMSSLFNGTNGSGEINAQLTNTIPDLIQEDLLLNIDNDSQYDFLVDAFNENSLLDWTPTIKMFMYHGDADITVPYQNSVDTYNYFISQGASPNTISLRTIEGADHATGVVPYLEDFIDKLLVLK